MDSSKVWAKWTASKKDGSMVKLRIQDMPISRLNDVIDFNSNYFATKEAFHKAAGIPNNPEAIKECQELLSGMFLDDSVHVAICCLDDSPATGEILGVSSMAIKNKDKDDGFSDLKLKTEEWKRFFELIAAYHDMYDVMTEQSIERTYIGRGIGVHPQYGSLGIATEFCKMRSLVCKEQAVPVTMAWMTSLGTQKAADRAGWETVFEIAFSDLEKTMGKIFEGTPSSLKLMLKRI